MTKPLFYSILFSIYILLLNASFYITSMLMPVNFEQVFLSGEIATVIMCIGIICGQSMTIWQIKRSPTNIDQN